MAENEEELKSLLVVVKEMSEKAVLKLNIKKTNIMASGPNSLGQSLSCFRLFVTPGTAARQAFLSITNTWSLSNSIHRFSDAIQPSHPLFSSSLFAFNLAQYQGLFQ